MNPMELSRAFDPLDLEIIERAYEAAWTKIEKYDPQRDTSKDPEYKQMLRRTLFLVAYERMSDSETLCHEALVRMVES
jgi:hypothetical protein